jgi:type IV pilus assembly protein PilA
MTRTASRLGPNEAGFTLIELLTIMVILGVLTAIAMPVFLIQRGKANDTATKHDLAEVAKQVTAAFVETGSAPTVRIVGGAFQVNGEVVGPVSHGVVVAGGNPAAVDTAGWQRDAWCMTLTNTDGDTGDYRFSVQKGLQAGTCSSPTAP